MSRNRITNRMKLDQAKKLYDSLTPEERLAFNVDFGLMFKSALDRVRDGYERLTDDERVEFEDWKDDHYHAECGERLPEDPEDHECPFDDDEEDDDDPDSDDGGSDSEEDDYEDDAGSDEGPASEPGSR